MPVTPRRSGDDVSGVGQASCSEASASSVFVAVWRRTGPGLLAWLGVIVLVLLFEGWWLGSSGLSDVDRRVLVSIVVSRAMPDWLLPLLSLVAVVFGAKEAAVAACILSLQYSIDRTIISHSEILDFNHAVLSGILKLTFFLILLGYFIRANKSWLSLTVSAQFVKIGLLIGFVAAEKQCGLRSYLFFDLVPEILMFASILQGLCATVTREKFPLIPQITTWSGVRHDANI